MTSSSINYFISVSEFRKIYVPIELKTVVKRCGLIYASQSKKKYLLCYLHPYLFFLHCNYFKYSKSVWCYFSNTSFLCNIIFKNDSYQTRHHSVHDLYVGRTC